MTKLSKKEFISLILASTVLLAWSSLPDWAGYAAQNSQSSFGGIYFDAADYAVHIAMLRTGMHGAWGYNLRFTSEPHTTAYIRMFYIALGEINRPFQAPPELVYQIARWVLGYAALFSIYLLTKRCFGDSRWSWLAFLIAVLGAGLGWLQRIFGWIPSQITPIDFWLIDCYVLFSLSLFPHFALTLALMCAAYITFLDYLEQGNPLRIVITAAAAVVAQFVNPVAFAVVDVAITAAALVFWLKQDGRRASIWISLLCIALSQIPLLLYNLEILTTAPLWSQFTVQDMTLSPPPVYYLWGFGLFWPLAAFGIVDAFRRRNVILLSSLAWVIAGFALAYAPFAIQRRFLLGITIPLSLLAADGLALCIQFGIQKSSWLSRHKPASILLVGLFISMTSLIFYPAQALYILQRPPEYYYPQSLNKAFNWIETNTQFNDLIFSAPRTGQLVAQKTGRRVYVGHEMETINYHTKARQIKLFYQSGTSQDWPQKYPDAWVIYGPYESDIAPVFQPSPNLDLAFQSDSVSIYKWGGDSTQGYRPAK